MERSAFCKNLKSAFPSFYNNYTAFITPSDYSILNFPIMDGGGPDTAPDLVLKVNSHKITNMYFFSIFTGTSVFPPAREHKGIFGFHQGKGFEGQQLEDLYNLDVSLSPIQKP